jgi:hypothetical protein
MLRDAYLHHSVAGPEEEWLQSVMGQVRQEPHPVRPIFTKLELVAWRTGWAMALAASLFAILSLAVTPSRDRLAWDLYKGGAMAQWSAQIGE